MGFTHEFDVLAAALFIFRLDALVIVGAAAVGLVVLLLVFRDGRAVGTRSRPDLSTVPGM